MKPCDQITDAGWCPVLRIAHPTGSVCRTCPHYTGPKPPPPGLGDRIEQAIDILSLGQGKRIAQKIARKRGKSDCGCNKRKQKLNELGKRLTGSKASSSIRDGSQAEDGSD